MKTIESRLPKCLIKVPKFEENSRYEQAASIRYSTPALKTPESPVRRIEMKVPSVKDPNGSMFQTQTNFSKHSDHSFSPDHQKEQSSQLNHNIATISASGKKSR